MPDLTVLLDVPAGVAAAAGVGASRTASRAQGGTSTSGSSRATEPSPPIRPGSSSTAAGTVDEVAVAVRAVVRDRLACERTAVDVDLFREVVGQDRAVAQLRAAAAEPVHAYLFVGPSGSGKRAAAHAFAAALLAPAGADRDDRDARLALAGTHPDLLLVEREGASISAKQADDIVRAASLSPIEGDRKVLVLDEFHLMTAAVAPKLLKTIEEPPAATIFVVLADDVPPELVTIASRCVRIDFGPVPVALVESTLVERKESKRRSARLAAAAAGGDLDRARLLVGDSGLATRRQAWHDIPKRLDGAGATVGAIVDELLELIDQRGRTAEGAPEGRGRSAAGSASSSR